jgi:ATP-dependent Clp protease ATP-binding subunit ClpA
MRGRPLPLVGRVNELAQLQKILLADRSAVLTGKPGVGKSALVEGLAWSIENEPEQLIEETRRIRLVAIQASDLIAGSEKHGALQKRLQEFIAHILQTSNLVIFVDEIHSLLSGSESSGRIIVDELKPVLARGTVRVIGASTDSEYQQFFQSDRALRERFRRLVLNQPSIPETIEIMTKIGDSLLSDRVANRGVVLSEDGIHESIELASKHYLGDSRPRKPINIIKEAAAEKAFQLATGESVDGVVGVEDVRSVVANELNVNEDLLASESFTQATYLRAEINAELRDRDKEAGQITHALALALSGLSDPKLPMSTLAITGDMSEVRKVTPVLAKVLCGSPTAVYPIDVASLAIESGVFQLRGAPQGYKDSGEGSNVFNAVGVDGRPHVIVFENIAESAPLPGQLTALIRAMLSGRARNGRNEETNFSKCIFLFVQKSTDISSFSNVLGSRVAQLIDEYIEFTPRKISYSEIELEDLINERLADAPEELVETMALEATRQSILDRAQERGLRRSIDDHLKAEIVKQSAAAK